jgi:hypothetical protein
MNKYLIALFSVLAGVLSAAACAASGEYWEITSRTVIPGTSFAMPATTRIACIPAGDENDPRESYVDQDCQMSSIRAIGNKTTWEVRCNHNGEVMAGNGEQITTADGFEGTIQFTDTPHDSDMHISFSGKRLGSSCEAN